VAWVLSAEDVEGPTRWRWLLTDENGAALADHTVDLGADSPEYAAFRDLPAHLLGVSGGVRAEAAAVSAVAEWVYETVFGPDLWRLLDDVVVTVPVGSDAGFLLGYPLELARHGGESLARRQVSLVYDLRPAGQRAIAKDPIGDELRILALYSLPTRQRPLALRRERYELARTVQRIVSRSGKAIELRILQYGVTRDRLRATVEEYPGWDILHVSGHGLGGALVLENDDGTADEVSTEDLVDLLRPARRRLKLAVLSVCHSGADGVAEILRTVGMPAEAAGVQEVADAERAATAAGGTATGLARGLADRLDIAVVAMRYPVADSFASEVCGQLYPRLLEQGQPLARALALALPPAIDRCAGVPISAAVTAVCGASATDLVLRPPTGRAVLDLYAERMASFPPEPDTFVGRSGALIAASAALAPDSGRSGVLFLGPRGSGTTSCALELAYQHRGRAGRLVWWEPEPGGALGAALTGLGAAWSAQLGVPLDRELSSQAELQAFLPRLRAMLREQSFIFALDNIRALLTPGGTWRDPRWGQVFAVLTGHGGDSRVILTSDVAPADLDTTTVLVQPVSGLSPLEGILAMGELPHLRGLVPAVGSQPRSAAETADAVVDDTAATRRLLTLTGGNPFLLALADSIVADLSDGVGPGPGDEADASTHRTLLARVECGDDRDAIVADLRRALQSRP
jgi:hypothetical protein